MTRNSYKASLNETVPMAPKPIHDSTPCRGTESVTIALDNLPDSLARITCQLDIVSSHNDSLFILLDSLGRTEYPDSAQPERGDYNNGALGYLQYLASLLEYQNQRRDTLLRALSELI